MLPTEGYVIRFFAETLAAWGRRRLYNKLFASLKGLIFKATRFCMNYIEVLDGIDAAVWGPSAIILLLAATFTPPSATKGIQRKLPLALKLSVTKDNDAQGDVSNFGAMATSLASTLGTGSIVGVATAVLSGGPGAVLWMAYRHSGMATKYTEVYAAMKYRVKDRQGHMMGGAMHVWEQR